MNKQRVSEILRKCDNEKNTVHDEFGGLYLVKSRFKAINKIAIHVKTLYSANHFTFHAKNKTLFTNHENMMSFMLKAATRE